MAARFHHPPMKTVKLDDVLHALSDPVRRRILFKLTGCEGMNCGNACDDLPPSTISFHYRVLREAGLIHSQKKGVEVINTSRKSEVEKQFPGLLHAIFLQHKKFKSKK